VSSRELEGPHSPRVVALLFEQPPVPSSAAILQLAVEHLDGEVAADGPDDGEIGHATVWSWKTW
jgi:hypothetical protein